MPALAGGPQLQQQGQLQRRSAAAVSGSRSPQSPQRQQQRQQLASLDGGTSGSPPGGATLDAAEPLTEIEAATASHCKSVCATAYDILKAGSTYDQQCQQLAQLLDADCRGDYRSCVGRQQDNLAKNRYNDVMPFDSNRVVLPGPQDYINASFVHDPNRHCLHPCHYIATQGPLPHTVGDFWRMVAATNTSAIVMLSTAEDLERGHCTTYFPATEKSTLQLPGISVRCVYKAQMGACLTLRQLELVMPDSGTQRWINHYHYDCWPDYGVPSNSEQLRQLCHALDDCRRIGCHITVHCSAGIGRTGTFLAIDILLQRLLWLKLQVQQSLTPAIIGNVLNVYGLVAALRQQRAGMVQTGDQYGFIYSVVMEQLLAYESELSEILQSAPPAVPQQRQPDGGAASGAPGAGAVGRAARGASSNQKQTAAASAGATSSSTGAAAAAAPAPAALVVKAPLPAAGCMATAAIQSQQQQQVQQHSSSSHLQLPMQMCAGGK